MAKATVFTNNKSQAVRLPKAVALPDSVKQVEVIKVGKARLITPADSSWDTFFDGPTLPVVSGPRRHTTGRMDARTRRS